MMQATPTNTWKAERMIFAVIVPTTPCDLTGPERTFFTLPTAATNAVTSAAPKTLTIMAITTRESILASTATEPIPNAFSALDALRELLSGTRGRIS